MTEAVQNPSPHLLASLRASRKTAQQGSQPKATDEPAGERNVAQRGRAQGRENITHQETRSSCYGGSQDTGPTVEDKQSSENINWNEALLSKVCGAERAR